MASALGIRPCTARPMSLKHAGCARPARSLVAARPYCQAGKRIGKSELKHIVAEKTNMTQKQAGEVLEIVLETIVENVAVGTSVSIPGFGVFEKRHRQARKGRNPQSGEPLDIAAKDVPGFTAGKTFKQRVADTATIVLEEGAMEEAKVKASGKS